MKKLLLFSALICFAFLAKAQSTSYHAFKVDIGLGYAGPSSGTAEAGAAFSIEPHYRLSDDLAIGLRLEGAALIFKQSDGTTKGAVLSSYCPSVDYYLSDNTFRPFVGAGLGIFDQASVSADDSGDNATVVQGGAKFGAFPRIGFEVGHFRLSADYDIVASGTNYFAINIGAFFGGGKQ
jgi:outer membrane protein X